MITILKSLETFLDSMSFSLCSKSSSVNLSKAEAIVIAGVLEGKGTASSSFTVPPGGVT